jgi:hypothetical protein
MDTSCDHQAMAYALVTQVNLEGRDAEESERLLNETVIPTVRQLPGFVRGVWLRSEDGSTGTGIVVFESEDQAVSARDGMGSMRPADAPPITSAEIHVVSGLG